MQLKPKQLCLTFLPVINNLKNYNNSSVWIADLIAGITVGLTLIPQSIAYAALAGLGPQYGLYSSLCGGIIYMIFGTIPELNIAPTALLSLLTYSYTNNSKFGTENAAVLLCFLSGIVELICGLLHLGFLIDFVSTPVVAGFTSAAAITIAFAQFKNLLGLKFQAESLIDVIINIVTQIQDTKLWDAVLSLCCCLFLLGLRELKKYGSSPHEKIKANSTNRKLIWFLSVSRNAIIVVSCAVIAYICNYYGSMPFSLTSQVEAGFPTVVPPNFTFSNETHTSFDMVKELGSGIFIVPLIAILSNVAIAKAFSSGKVVNASQEMVAVGICNIIGAFFSSMPVNASFSRGAVSNASGVRTPISGLYTGILVILSLGFLTPYFSFIPKSTLASVIVCAVIFMVEVETCKSVWKINKLDFLPLSITFFACLFLGIEVGIILGIVLNILIVLYFAARPKVTLETVISSSGDYLKITIFSSLLFYPSAEYIRELIMKEDAQTYEKKFKNIVLDCDKVCKMDFTTANCLTSLLADFSTSGRQIIIYKLRSDSVKTILLKASNEQCTILQNETELNSFLRERRNSNIDRISFDSANTISIGVINSSYMNDENKNSIDDIKSAV